MGMRGELLKKTQRFSLKKVLVGGSDTRQIKHRLITLLIHCLSCVCDGMTVRVFQPLLK